MFALLKYPWTVSTSGQGPWAFTKKREQQKKVT